MSITSSQRNDRLGFQTSWGVRIDAELQWRDLRCRVTSRDDRTLRVAFDAVPANTQGEAYLSVCEAMTVIVPLMSLGIQREHHNRHYGPIRATWSRATVDVSPADDWPATSVAMRSERNVVLTNANNHLGRLAAAPELRPLLLSYNRALAPDDDETRFFNAFAIIEFIEGRFARARFPALLDDAGAIAIVDAARACATDRNLPDRVVERVGHLLAGPLRRATVDGRESKLLAVLHDDFAIVRVEDAIGAVDVDRALVRRFTDARNRLFHGGARADDALFARLTDHLTLVVEAVLDAFLENRVAIPPPEA